MLGFPRHSLSNTQTYKFSTVMSPHHALQEPIWKQNHSCRWEHRKLLKSWRKLILTVPWRWTSSMQLDCYCADRIVGQSANGPRGSVPTWSSIWGHLKHAESFQDPTSDWSSRLSSVYQLFLKLEVSEQDYFSWLLSSGIIPSANHIMLYQLSQNLKALRLV